VLIKFGVDFVTGGGVGFVVGAFTPAIGRAIKSKFVSESKKLIADAKAEETKVAADAKAEVKKV
jgi:hypothetical protein